MRILIAAILVVCALLVLSLPRHSQNKPPPTSCEECQTQTVNAMNKRNGGVCDKMRAGSQYCAAHCSSCPFCVSLYQTGLEMRCDMRLQ